MTINIISRHSVFTGSPATTIIWDFEVSQTDYVAFLNAYVASLPSNYLFNVTFNVTGGGYTTSSALEWLPHDINGQYFIRWVIYSTVVPNGYNINQITSIGFPTNSSGGYIGTQTINIANQPPFGKLMAAYRPVIVSATIAPTPPVAYCDVYIAGVYYKTISKTHLPFDFDIQDVMQEYIQKFIPPNGGSQVETDTLFDVYVKIRASHIDANKFIAQDGPIPVQATGNIPAVGGGGTQSNYFWVANATLQHEDNQELALHLNYFKNGTWQAESYPLTHRPNVYKICKGDSDYFPMITCKDIAAIRITTLNQDGTQTTLTNGVTTNNAYYANNNPIGCKII